MRLDRRQFLAAAAATALLPRHGPAAEALGTPLRIEYREIQAKTRTTSVSEDDKEALRHRVDEWLPNGHYLHKNSAVEAQQ